MDWNTVSAELAKPLDSAHVKPPAPGQFGEYIEGWRAIDEANRIFGFDGWSYRIDGLTQTNCEQGVNRKNVEIWKTGYMATVTVTVDGVSRQDMGCGFGDHADKRNSIEGAAKEAVTDALKRALRTFGNPFGLALYDKTKANVVDVAAQDRAAEARAELEHLCSTMLAALDDCPPEELDAFPKHWEATIKRLSGEARDLRAKFGTEYKKARIRAADDATAKGANAA